MLDMKLIKEIRDKRAEELKNVSDEELEYNIIELDDVDSYLERGRRTKES